MSILTNCYKLNELIGKAYEIIKSNLPSLGKLNTDLVNKISIDPEIQSHILFKVNDVTAYLLNIAEDNVLEFLMKDPDIQNNNFLGPVEKEYNLRKKKNIKNYFNKVQRGINRFVYVSETKSDIIDNLSLINSFFIIIKSQYDFALQLYEREFGEEWKNILTEIENTKEYANYLIPVQNLPNETSKIVKGEDEIGKVAKGVENSLTNNSLENNPENNNGNTVANNVEKLLQTMLKMLLQTIFKPLITYKLNKNHIFYLGTCSSNIFRVKNIYKKSANKYNDHSNPNYLLQQLQICAKHIGSNPENKPKVLRQHHYSQQFVHVFRYN